MATATATVSTPTAAQAANITGVLPRVIGNMGQEATFGTTAQGGVWAALRIGVNDPKDRDRDATWLDVMVFGSPAKTLQDLKLAKGTRLYLEGNKGALKSYTRKDGSTGYTYSFVAQKFVILSPKAEDGGAAGEPVAEDSIPF